MSPPVVTQVLVYKGQWILIKGRKSYKSDIGVCADLRVKGKPEPIDDDDQFEE